MSKEVSLDVDMIAYEQGRIGFMFDVIVDDAGKYSPNAGKLEAKAE